MRRLPGPELLERLLFTTIVLGLLLAAYAGLRYVEASQTLAGNQAAQIHEAGGEVAVESAGEGYSLMTSDLERRRLHAQQSNMMVVGGIGLALLGIGWLGYDLMRGRRRRNTEDGNS